MSILHSKFNPKCVPVNLRLIRVDTTRPNKLNLVTPNTTEVYSVVEFFMRILSMKTFDRKSPSQIFERSIYDTALDTPDLTNIAAILLKFIPDQTFDIPQTLPQTQAVLQFHLKYYSWSLTMGCIHYRLKMRLSDETGTINPLFRNIAALRYCHTSLYVQLLGRNQILEVMRNHPIIFPTPEMITDEISHWKV